MQYILSEESMSKLIKMIGDPYINTIEQLDNRLSQVKQLTQLGLKHNTDKAYYHNFTDFYDSIFSFDKASIKTVFEVGVLNGGSIKMWREYFKNSKIYCFDIDKRLEENVKGLNNVIFRQLDQGLKISISRAIYDIPLNSVDIIIDDGSHLISHQKNTLEVMWPYLKSGGFYVVEDIHTNVKHWYDSDYYCDQDPSLLETLSKIQLGVPINSTELDLPVNEIKNLILWSKPSTKSATFVLVKL